MGLDMGLILTKKKEYLETVPYDDRYDYDELINNKFMYDEDGEFKWPDICEVWYARKFWDMVHGVPELNEFAREPSGYYRIQKEILKKMIDFHCYHQDYFDGFNSLPRLCELYRDYDEYTAQGLKLYLYISY